MLTSAGQKNGSVGAVVLVMGVSACGKSTLGKALAESLGARFLDADDFHPKENVAKMSSGEPLTDDDRRGWLERLNAELKAGTARGETLVLACSALKADYRKTLRQGIASFTIVFLDGSRAILEARLHEREGHFMPASLLDSQLATLERPDPEASIRIDFECPVDEAVAKVRARLPSDISRD